MNIPGFGAGASLYRTAVPRAAVAASEQPVPVVYPAQSRWESILSQPSPGNVIPPECPFPLVPRYVETGGTEVCTVKDVPRCNPVTRICTSIQVWNCSRTPRVARWECQFPRFTVAQ